MNDSISPSLYIILTADFLGLVGKLINNDMKKFMFIATALLMSLSASAQFTVFEPVNPPRSSTRSSTYNPYNSVPSDPYGGYYGNTQPSRSKQYTLTGYYKKTDGWYKTQIKVSVSDEEIRLVSVKYGNNWAGCSSKVSEVGAFDSQEVQDNFNYKGYFTYLGTIYF